MTGKSLERNKYRGNNVTKKTIKTKDMAPPAPAPSARVRVTAGFRPQCGQVVEDLGRAVGPRPVGGHCDDKPGTKECGDRCVPSSQVSRLARRWWTAGSWWCRCASRGSARWTSAGRETPAFPCARYPLQIMLAVKCITDKELAAGEEVLPRPVHRNGGALQRYLRTGSGNSTQ